MGLVRVQHQSKCSASRSGCSGSTLLCVGLVWDLCSEFHHWVQSHQFRGLRTNVKQRSEKESKGALRAAWGLAQHLLVVLGPSVDLVGQNTPGARVGHLSSTCPGHATSTQHVFGINLCRRCSQSPYLTGRGMASPESNASVGGRGV